MSNHKEGKVYVSLGSYLANLEAQGRMNVPTIRSLAGSIGMHEVTLHNIAKGRSKQLNLETAQRILDEMNRRGFKMDISDLVKYDPPEM